MRSRRTARYRGVDRGLGQAVLKGLITMCSSGLDAERFNPPLYPRNAQARDLERIGGDLYAAFEGFKQVTESPDTEQASD